MLVLRLSNNFNKFKTFVFAVNVWHSIDKEFWPRKSRNKCLISGLTSLLITYRHWIRHIINIIRFLCFVFFFFFFLSFHSPVALFMFTQPRIPSCNIFRKNITQKLKINLKQTCKIPLISTVDCHDWKQWQTNCALIASLLFKREDPNLWRDLSLVVFVIFR